MRTKAYGEELNAETLENVTGGGFVARPQTLPERLGWNKWWLKEDLLMAIRSYHEYQIWEREIWINRRIILLEV